MARPTGNRQLKAARLACGFGSQEALAAALNAAAAELGLRGVGIGQRQVRRWESSRPPWPQAHHQRLLTHVLGLRVDELGFEPPWGEGDDHLLPADPPVRTRRRANDGPGTSPRPSTRAVEATIGNDIATVTVAHRRLYWSTSPSHLHPAVTEHVRLGEPLLRHAIGSVRITIGRALAESALLAGRIEFFDLRDPHAAAETFVRAMQFAEDADDQLLGAAILAHAAFVPGWSGQRDAATERIAAARAYARRGSAPPLFRAWLHAVEGECLTRCGDTSAALACTSRGEQELTEEGDGEQPAWMDWFSPIRLAAFKGNTQLAAGQLRRARETLVGVLDRLPGSDIKQRSVVAADLAAVEVAAEDIPAACARAGEALDALAEIWYAAGMERIRQVRRDLRPWQHHACVRDLDDRLYGWNASLSAMSG